jgi:hypothetical protein
MTEGTSADACASAAENLRPWGIAKTSRRMLTDEQRARIKRLREGGFTMVQIAERVRIPRQTVAKCCRRGFGRKTVAPPPPPGDFALFGAVETIEQLQVRYGRGRDTIRRWIREKGIVRPNLRYRNAYRERPADFAEHAPGLTIAECESRWNACYWLITRWRAEIGLGRPRAARKDRITAKPTIGWVERFVAEGRAS